MPCVLGIDGGGTHTRCALFDDKGHLLGFSVGGPSNYGDVGVDTARRNLHQVIITACNAHGVMDVVSVFLGMANVVSEADRETIRGMLDGLGLSPEAVVGVSHDCRVALMGGTGGAPGIVLIVGTGSSCYGRDASGRDWRSGGWGYLIDDIGSAFYLGKQALTAVIRAQDGRARETKLTAPVMHALGLRDPNDLMRRIYHPKLDRASIAALAPIVIELADSDEEVARIIKAGCEELARMVAAVEVRLDFPEGPHVVPVGGLVDSSNRVWNELESCIREAVPAARVERAVAPPVIGAALLACEQAGISADAVRLAASASNWGNT